MSKPATDKQERAPDQAVFVKTYGCQMNVNDTEVVISILQKAGYRLAADEGDANVVLINTCAIREQAEAKIWGKLQEMRHQKKIRKHGPIVGLLGCMAERLKDKLLRQDRLVDIVAGPDAYRDLPNLLQAIRGGVENAMNVQLSTEETYADIMPVRPDGAVSAFVTIMRGCNNMCSFCIVPFTRGRERSRPSTSILDEIRLLRDQGVKQVTLLGQNVNSYSDYSDRAGQLPSRAERARAGFGVYAAGFKSVYKPVREGAIVFSELLHRVADIDPELRVRFTSPHPKDFGTDCLAAVAAHPNICKLLHMPAQSGASSNLARMKRGYTREAYDALVARVAAAVPGASFSTDMIVGFCGETEAEHAASLDLLRRMRYPFGFLFAYSERATTRAARRLADDVPADVKRRRLNEAMAVYKSGALERRAELIGTRQLVLVEGFHAKDPSLLEGRTDSYHRICFPADALTRYMTPELLLTARIPVPGDYVALDVVSAERGRLLGRPLGTTTLTDFVAAHGSCNPGQVPEKSLPAGMRQPLAACM